MKSKKIVISLFLIISIILLQNVCFAAVAINGGTPWTNITANNSFEQCLNMKNAATSTLGTNKLDPHLTTASDWGAVAYLGASEYGNVKSATGDQITISSSNGPSTLTTAKSFYTTTGNASGVMDFGLSASNSSVNVTQTAALYSDYIEDTNTNTYTNLSVLKAKGETKYVEKLISNVNIGKAGSETMGWYSSSYNFGNAKYPLLIRSDGAFGSGWASSSSYIAQGNNNVTATFRPVIWNIDTTK